MFPLKIKQKEEAKMKMNLVDWVTFVLVVVGGVNWGLVGAINYNLVESLLGSWPMVMRIVYDLVGLSALYMVYHMFMKN